MLATINPPFWLIGITVLIAVTLLVRGHFTAEAREARRRARSHGRVVSKGRGPMVKLAVETEKEKEDR